jgi:hypothetical protein
MQYFLLQAIVFCGKKYLPTHASVIAFRPHMAKLY